MTNKVDTLSDLSGAVAAFERSARSAEDYLRFLTAFKALDRDVRAATRSELLSAIKDGLVPPTPKARSDAAPACPPSPRYAIMFRNVIVIEAMDDDRRNGWRHVVVRVPAEVGNITFSAIRSFSDVHRSGFRTLGGSWPSSTGRGAVEVRCEENLYSDVIEILKPIAEPLDGFYDTTEEHTAANLAGRFASYFVTEPNNSGLRDLIVPDHNPGDAAIIAVRHEALDNGDVKGALLATSMLRMARGERKRLATAIEAQRDPDHTSNGLAP